MRILQVLTVLSVVVLGFAQEHVSLAVGRTVSETIGSPGNGASTQNGKPKKFALLVGINNYLHADKLSSLEGTENDVDDMKDLLMRKFGFASVDIVTLKGPQATRDAIIKTFREHLGQAGKGDIVLFHFSGHGSRIQDVAEPDGWDETIVPYDSRDDQKTVTDIRDKELNTLLRELSAKTQNITVILDSCFSGTGVKGVERVRTASPDLRFGPHPPPSPLVLRPRDAGNSTSGLYSADLKYALIAASRMNQFSFEHFADNKEHGALTYFLTRELLKPSVPRTYRTVMNIVGQQVNALYPNQSPQLEGALRDQYVLDVGGESVSPYVLATTGEGQVVKLGGGQIEGFTIGSIFDVFKTYSDFQHHRTPFATVEITDVDGPEESKTKLLSGNAALPLGSIAIERVHSFPPEHMRLFYEGLSTSDTLRAVKQLVDATANNGVTSLDDIKGAQLVLAQRGNEILTMGPDGSELSVRATIGDPNLATGLKERVLAFVNWYLVLGAINPRSDLSVVFKCIPSGADPNKPVFAVKNEADVHCDITNNTDRTLYVYIMDLTSTDSYHLLYPPLGETHIIEPHGHLSTPPIGLSVPSGLDHVQDIFKLVVATDELKALPLMVQGVRAADATALNPLEQLFSRALGFKARDADLKVAQDWTTANIDFTVSR